MISGSVFALLSVLNINVNAAEFDLTGYDLAIATRYPRRVGRARIQEFIGRTL